jgi:proton glutamate symport protein
MSTKRLPSLTTQILIGLVAGIVVGLLFPGFAVGVGPIADLFLRMIRMIIAFTTTSSEAALPKALEVMERFGVPRDIVAFVLPTGYSFNLDGSTLYLSLTSVFVAQLAGGR